MVRVLTSKTGASVVIASVVIASDDHCPPHVHARHRGERWVVRIRFSFLSDAVAVMDIAPSEDVVRQRQLNEMVDEVTLHLAACREIWWDGKRTTCLQNMWLMLAGFDGLAVVDGQRPGARQVRFARYDVLARRTILVFSDGTDHSISAGRAE